MPPPNASPPGFAPVLERNISALIEHRRRFDGARTRGERVADAISRFAGSMRSVYAHLAFFGTWVVINLGATPVPAFDSSFVILAMIASVEAIFLSTFVLMTQNRLAAEADRRADLDLQISLLAEHEITRVIQLVSAIGRQVGVPESANPALDPLKQEVHPEQVLDHLEAVNRNRAP